MPTKAKVAAKPAKVVKKRKVVASEVDLLQENSFQDVPAPPASPPLPLFAPNPDGRATGYAYRTRYLPAELKQRVSDVVTKHGLRVTGTHFHFPCELRSYPAMAVTWTNSRLRDVEVCVNRAEAMPVPPPVLKLPYTGEEALKTMFGGKTNTNGESDYGAYEFTDVDPTILSDLGLIVQVTRCYLSKGEFYLPFGLERKLNEEYGRNLYTYRSGYFGHKPSSLKEFGYLDNHPIVIHKKDLQDFDSLMAFFKGFKNEHLIKGLEKSKERMDKGQSVKPLVISGVIFEDYYRWALDKAKAKSSDGVVVTATFDASYGSDFTFKQMKYTASNRKSGANASLKVPLPAVCYPVRNPWLILVGPHKLPQSEVYEEFGSMAASQEQMIAQWSESIMGSMKSSQRALSVEISALRKKLVQAQSNIGGLNAVLQVGTAAVRSNIEAALNKIRTLPEVASVDFTKRGFQVETHPLYIEEMIRDEPARRYTGTYTIRVDAVTHTPALLVKNNKAPIIQTGWMSYKDDYQHPHNGCTGTFNALFGSAMENFDYFNLILAAVKMLCSVNVNDGGAYDRFKALPEKEPTSPKDFKKLNDWMDLFEGDDYMDDDDDDDDRDDDEESAGW